MRGICDSSYSWYGLPERFLEGSQASGNVCDKLTGQSNCQSKILIIEQDPFLSVRRFAVYGYFLCFVFGERLSFGYDSDDTEQSGIQTQKLIVTLTLPSVTITWV